MNILLLSYHFFDTNKIGSKRWRNYAKFLSKNNTIDIVSCDKSTPDINFINENYHIKPVYPTILDLIPKNIFQKISYKLGILKQKLSTQGYFYDRGAVVINKLEKLLIHLHYKNNYDIIISTGAPFSWVVLPVLLKKENILKNTLIYSDLRDPWTWGDGYGMKLLSDKRLVYEKNNERMVLEFSDKIFVPSVKMKKDLKEKYDSTNIIHLPHGFDKEKIELSVSKKIKESKTLKIIYAGTWYYKVDVVYDYFIKTLEKYFSNYNFKIFTNDNIKISANEKILKSKYVPEEKLFFEISISDFYVLVFPDEYIDFLSSKLFEICYIGTPILYIGKKGLLSDFITKNQFGYHIEETKIDAFLKGAINLKKLKPNKNILEKYSFEILSKLIVNDINNNSKLQ